MDYERRDHVRAMEIMERDDAGDAQQQEPVSRLPSGHEHDENERRGQRQLIPAEHHDPVQQFLQRLGRPVVKEGQADVGRAIAETERVVGIVATEREGEGRSGA